MHVIRTKKITTGDVMGLIESKVIEIDNACNNFLLRVSDNVNARKLACNELNTRKKKFGRGAAGCVKGEFVLDRNKIQAELAILFNANENLLLNLENAANKPTIEDLIFLQPYLRHRLERGYRARK